MPTTREVAFQLNWDDSQVPSTVEPIAHHPITGEPRYSLDSIEPHRGNIHSIATALNDILDYCQQRIHGNGQLKAVVRRLVHLGHIPKAGNDESQFIYLNLSSENMVKAIYENHRYMTEQNIQLLTIAQAAEQMLISEKQLRHLVDYYGVAEALSSGKRPKTVLYGNRFGMLQVPYVVYTPGIRLYFLASPIVTALDSRIRTLQEELRANGKELQDTPWRAKLAHV